MNLVTLVVVFNQFFCVKLRKTTFICEDESLSIMKAILRSLSVNRKEAMLFDIIFYLIVMYIP